MAREEVGAPKVLTVLFRDSVLNFGGILAIIVANVVICSAARVGFIAGDSIPPLQLTMCFAPVVAYRRRHWVSARLIDIHGLLARSYPNDRPMVAAPSILGCRMLVRKRSCDVVHRFANGFAQLNIQQACRPTTYASASISELVARPPSIPLRHPRTSRTESTIFDTMEGYGSTPRQQSVQPTGC